MHFLTAKVMKLMNTAKADGPKSKIMKKKVNLVYHRYFQFCLLQSTKYRKIVYYSQQNITKLFAVVNNLSYKIPDAYIAADNVEYGSYNKIPLWLFGFLY